MNRRQFHSRAAVATVSLVAATGCAQLLGDLNIVNASAQSPTAGTVILTVLVENTAPVLQSATLVARIAVGGETYTKRRDITVPGNSSNRYEFEFDVDQDEIAGGEVNISAEIR